MAAVTTGSAGRRRMWALVSASASVGAATSVAASFADHRDRLVDRVRAAVALSLVIFTGELRGPAVAVTVVDDAVVRWLAGLDGPGLSATMKVLAVPGSWAAITALLWGLLLALIDASTVAPSARRGRGVDVAGIPHPVPAGADAASAAAVRGGVPDRLVCVGVAVRADGGASGHGGRDLVRPGARGPLASDRQVDRRRRWWRWSPLRACTSGWRRPPMWSWVWSSG